MYGVADRVLGVEEHGGTVVGLKRDGRVGESGPLDQGTGIGAGQDNDAIPRPYMIYRILYRAPGSGAGGTGVGIVAGGADEVVRGGEGWDR